MESMHYSTDKKMSVGSPYSSDFDGIHPKGKYGSKLYHKCLISAIKSARISSPRERVEVQEARTPVNNMFDVLN